MYKRQSLAFEVPRELGIEGGADVPFEFRFTHFGNALLTMVAVTLHREPMAAVPDNVPAELEPWRLLGRLRTLPPVSYTHLDVYKRQIQISPISPWGSRRRVSGSAMAMANPVSGEPQLALT